MKKILFSFILITSVFIFSAHTNKLNTNTATNSFIQGISGTVTYNGAAVASQTVTISKDGFSISTTTDAYGHYSVLGELGGEGTYTARVSWCDVKYTYSGSNSGYFNLYQVTINISVTRQVGGCQQ